VAVTAPIRAQSPFIPPERQRGRRPPARRCPRGAVLDHRVLGSDRSSAGLPIRLPTGRRSPFCRGDRSTEPGAKGGHAPSPTHLSSPSRAEPILAAFVAAPPCYPAEAPDRTFCIAQDRLHSGKSRIPGAVVPGVGREPKQTRDGRREAACTDVEAAQAVLKVDVEPFAPRPSSFFRRKGDQFAAHTPMAVSGGNGR
jgi:hypothetical protein